MVNRMQDDPKNDKSKPAALVEGEDYYFDEDGLMVFTMKYHLKRGYCCENGCRHCPYTSPPPPSSGSSGQI